MRQYWLWIGFFLSPFIVLVFSMGELAPPPMDELLLVLKNSTLQAGLSALLSVFLGVVFGLGLLKWPQRRGYKFLRIFITFPNFVPPLFVLLSFIYLVDSLSTFPFGFWGVILVHVFINVGLCAVIIENIVRSQMGGMWELALVEGAPKGLFFYHGVLRYLKRDLLTLYVFVFSLCFTGFTVPLLAGSVQPLSLSIYLFNKIRLEGDWGQALFLALLESACLFVFMIIKTKPIHSVDRKLTETNINRLGLPLFGFVLVGLTAPILFGDLAGVFAGLKSLLAEPHFFKPLIMASGYSFIIGIFVGLITLVGMLIFMGFSLKSFTIKFFSYYSSPSPIFLGFMVILTFPPEFFRPVLLIVGLFMLFFPTLFRMYGRSVMEPLIHQIDTARVMGASHWLTLKQVLVPQVIKPMCWLSGIASFWASGEFGLSRVLLGRDITLALLVETLMGAYRLDMATFVASWMLLVGALTFLIFIGVGNVLHRKLI